MKQLWENPKIVSFIILNSSNNDIKLNLADFFVNNFYENILSSNCIENNLLYIITLLLKDEIKNVINNENPENFLNSTKCGYFLERLIEKKEINMYFRSCIVEIIENLKKSYFNEEMAFNKDKLINNVFINRQNVFLSLDDNINNNEDLIIKNKNIYSLDLSYRNNDDIENYNIEKEKLFNEKYIEPLKEKDLNDFLSEYENNANQNNIQYYINHINNSIKSSSFLYETKNFSKNINEDKDIYNLYKDYYLKISELLDIILDNLLNNLNVLPYQIKCICKIISKLIIKKFPNIQNFQINSFISKFFFIFYFLHCYLIQVFWH